MSKSISITAVKFRLILSILLTVILSGMVVAIVFGYKLLNEKAEETSKIVYEAATSEERISNIQKNANYIEENRDIVNRAKQVVAASQSYQYQDIIVDDLRNIAKKSGVSIVNFDFSASTDSSGTASGAATNSATTSQTTDSSTTPQATALKTTTVNITIKNPVEYGKLLNFLYHIEQNLTKMQVSKVSLSKGGEGNKNQISTDALTIEVYVK